MASIATLMLAGALVGSTLGFAPPPTLAEARREEAAMLRNERSALQRSLANAKSSAAVAERALEVEVEGLATELARLQSDNAARERRLPSDSSGHSSETRERHLAEVMTQMQRWLGGRGETVPDATDPAALPALVATVLEHIKADASLHIEPDRRFFDARGDAMRGAVLRIGRVAALRWDGSEVPLVATKDGLQVVPGLAGNHRALSDGEAVRVVLHEPGAALDISTYAGATWRTKMAMGGPLMWVLLAFAGIGLGVAVERGFGLMIARLRWRQLARSFSRAASSSSQNRREFTANTWLAQPLSLLANSQARREPGLEERVTDAVLLVRERLFKRLSVLGVVAAVAPLIGLLGTVSGMIKTFTAVTSHAQTDPQSLAGGISEALLTTQFGLVIAIPALIIHVLLTRAARRVLADVEQTVLAELHAGPTLAGSPSGAPERPDVEEHSDA